ncbi:hypothetical protein AVEN_273491-1 [Araneus ventricosus]|uniref:Uncharacterized protein n=1 Tax=Araneus ventricosus TaxID=182803 RepID=A0A4Y2SZI0_ARAVE|nr:hypothetical protein AVEN_273491-1 [Araneus ventricosus]
MSCKAALANKVAVLSETPYRSHSIAKFIDFGIPVAEFNELLSAGETTEEWNNSQPIWDEEPMTSGMSKHGTNGNSLPIQDEEPRTSGTSKHGANG